MNKGTNKKASKEKDSKKSPAIQAKAEKKGAKASKSIEEAPVAPAEDGVDQDELEEQADIAASAGSGGAMTAPVPTETSVSFKNFRHHPDMENFYRFIYENDLRYEALGIIDQVLAEKLERKKVKLEKSKGH